VPERFSSASDARRATARLVATGLAAIVAILLAAGAFLLLTLPDANAFNARVERLFVENDDLSSQAEIRLLELLAQSGTAFSEVLASYRVVIVVLLAFATAMLIAAVVFLVMLVALGRRIAQIERTGIQVASLEISREERTVALNDMVFRLTDAAFETLSVLAEARLDDEVLTGAEIEAVISGRSAAECDEAAGATRIKRLRDSLGNQMVSELLVKTITRKGYTLAVDRRAIRLR
jgi:DNA-binding winged helix-turn-helix (wHTH) protein